MFDTIRSNKAPQQIISQIRKLILEGKLLPGDKLSPENKLMEQFNVSKQTVREALRALEFIGLIEISKGTAGGARMVEMDSQIALELLADYLYFKKLSIHHLNEARKVMEPYAAGIAAEFMSDTEKDMLKELIDLAKKEYKDNNLSMDASHYDLKFHCVIANSTKNPLLMLIVDFIESLMADTKSKIKPNKKMLAAILDAHERIYQAIVKKDPNRARTEMCRHITEVEDYMLKLRKKSAESNVLSNKKEV
jgi:GntR family transcriptional regulator, transcriptional repressor for pyruvate dehydrogenase complex